ncbi:hypothetical protein TRVL_00229 [Trypanosoma vivax]|nr:hypothetical protein TRVL_00229 [Trypanosoma vivax]
MQRRKGSAHQTAQAVNAGEIVQPDLNAYTGRGMMTRRRMLLINHLISSNPESSDGGNHAPASSLQLRTSEVADNKLGFSSLEYPVPRSAGARQAEQSYSPCKPVRSSETRMRSGEFNRDCSKIDDPIFRLKTKGKSSAFAVLQPAPCLGVEGNSKSTTLRRHMVSEKAFQYSPVCHNGVMRCDGGGGGASLEVVNLLNVPPSKLRHLDGTKGSCEVNSSAVSEKTRTCNQKQPRDLGARVKGNMNRPQSPGVALAKDELGKGRARRLQNSCTIQEASTPAIRETDTLHLKKDNRTAPSNVKVRDDCSENHIATQSIPSVAAPNGRVLRSLPVSKISRLNGGIWVHPSSIYLYIVPNVKRKLNVTSERALKALVSSGAALVQSIAELETRAQSSTITSEQGPRSIDGEISIFISADDADSDEPLGSGIEMAHAIGLSVVSVRWLDRLYADQAWSSQRVCLPDHTELIGQNGDIGLRCLLLPSTKRALSGKQVRFPGGRSCIDNLIVLAGGAVASQQAKNDTECSTLVPHFISVSPGTGLAAVDCTYIDMPDLASLKGFILDFFLTLPPWPIEPQNGDPALFAASTKAGKKHPRDDKEGPGEVATGVPNSHLPRIPVSFGTSSALLPTYESVSDYQLTKENEDYYFFLNQEGSNQNLGVESQGVALGCVVSIGDGAVGERPVTMRMYEVVDASAYEQPQTAGVFRHQRVCQSSLTVEVNERDLIFGTPVYIIDRASMKHVYLLGTPPGDNDLNSSQPNLSASTSALNSQLSLLHSTRTQKSGCCDGSLDEVIHGDKRLRCGTEICFRSSIPGELFYAPVCVGRIQQIKKSETSVLLVVKQQETDNVLGGGTLVTITPDMVCDVR